MVKIHSTKTGTMMLTAEQHFGAPAEDVFAFFADAANLEAMTPPWLHFQIRTPLPIKMQNGTLIDYRLRLHWIPIHWRTLISEWHPPVRFVDSQIQGPYRLWQHTHSFTESDNGTLMTDTVEYSVPGGRLINRLFVERDLRRIFLHRRKCLAKQFSTARPPTV